MRRMLVSLVQLSGPILVLLVASCAQQSPPEPELESTQAAALLDFIPARLPGFSGPLSATFDPGELLDGVPVPGGYAGRQWVDASESRFVLAFVTDWQSAEKARARLGAAAPAGARPLRIGESGFQGAAPDLDGRRAFRLLTFQRGPYLVLVGSGILDEQAEPTRSARRLARRIDRALRQHLNPHESLTDVALLEDDVTEGNSEASAARASLAPTPGLPGASALTTLSDPVTWSTTVRQRLKLDDGTDNGEVGLRFDVTDFGAPCDSKTCNPAPGVVCDCERFEVKVFLTEIALGAEDGDGWLRGDGDIRAAGDIRVNFSCDPQAASLEFVTRELAEVGPNTTKILEKFLGTLQGCQCPNGNPTTSFELLLRDNDEGDLFDILLSLLGLVPEKLGVSDEDVKRSRELLDKFSDKGQDTTGPKPFEVLRGTRGDDVGTGVTRDPVPLDPDPES